VWVNPQRGHAGSTAGGFWCCVAGAAWSTAPLEEQLATTSAIMTTPAAEAITRRGRHHVDPPLPDDTLFT
jgi:hypothetical protein